MRRSLLIVAAIAVVGSVWFVGAMPKRAQAQQAPIVRTLPPVAPLVVEETTLPKELVASIKKFVGQGIFDVRGGELRKVKIASEQAYQGGPADQEIMGWVMPADLNGNRMVVTLFGSIYPVLKVGDPVTVDEAYEKSYDMDQFMVEFSRAGGDRSLCKVVMLVIAGETKKAEEFYAKTMWRGYADSAYDTTLGQLFYNSNYSSATKLARNTDWENARSAAIRAKFCEEAQTNRPNYGYGFIRIKTDEIILDLERRIKDKKPAPYILDIVGMKGEVRRKMLIEVLDGSVKLEPSEPQLSVSSLIVEEGEAIIPDLIEAYRNDSRVSYSMSNYGNGFNTPQPVRNVIQQLISQLWVGMPSLPYSSTEGRYERTADFWASQWKEHSKLSAAQRYLNSIADMKASDRSASQSLRGLFAKGTGGSTVNYTPGRVPIILDQLNDTERKQLGDALEKRIIRFGDPVDQNPDFSSVGELCIGLAHIKGKDAVPALRQFSSEVLAKITTNDPNNWSQYGGALGAVISQRIALGDDKAALIDYKASLATFTIKNTLNQDALRAGWEHPNNAAVQDIVGATLSRAIKNLRNEGGYEVGRSYLMINSFRQDAWFGSLGIRRVIAGLIEDNTEIGKVKTKSQGDYISAEYTYPNGQGSTSYRSTDSNDFVIGKEMPLYAGDLSIMQIDRQVKDMQFILATPDEHRKSFRADFAKKLKDKGFDWKAHLDVMRYGRNDLEIYRP